MKKFLFGMAYVMLIIIATLLCILGSGYAFLRFLIAALFMGIAQLMFIYVKNNL